MTKLSLLLFFIIIISRSFSQRAGSIDLANFNPHSFHKTLSGNVNSVKCLADGKVIFGGNLSSSISSKHNIFRINSNRTLDTTFLAGNNINKEVTCIVQQSDGKFLVGGDFEIFGGQNVGGIIRLLEDGSIDPTFTLGTGAIRQIGSFNEGYVKTIEVQPDGKIIVAGLFNEFNAVDRNCIVRLNSDGTVDLTFDMGIGISNYTGNETFIEDVLLLPDGKIMVAGNFSHNQNLFSPTVSRINSDGTLDNTFVFCGTDANRILDIEKQGDFFLIGGTFGMVSTLTRRRICRIDMNGAVDPTFEATIEPGLGRFCTKMAVQADHSIVVSLSELGLRHLSKNGELIAKGGPNPLYLNGDYLDGYILTFDKNLKGEFVYGGNFNCEETSLNMSNCIGFTAKNKISDDLEVKGFGVSSDNYSLTSKVMDLEVLPDNSKLLVGNFKYYNNIEKNGIVKTLPNGFIDTTFKSGGGFIKGSVVGGFSIGEVKTVAIQTNGNILVGGVFNSYKGTPVSNIVSLLPDGSLDNGFNAHGDFSFIYSVDISHIYVQSDGKVIVCGNISYHKNDIFRRNIIRFFPNGSVDTSFNSLGGIDSYESINTVELQQDGKYLCGGNFSFFNNSPQKGIIRLLPNGRKDTTFIVGTGFSGENTGTYNVESIKMQSDGKAIVAGFFDSYNGAVRKKVVRLNQDGTVDTTFNTNLNSIDGYLHCIYIQPDGKIIVAGNNLNFNAIPVGSAIMLNPDGTLFLKLNSNLNEVFAVDLESSGKIIFGGSGFFQISAMNYNYLSRGLSRVENVENFLQEFDLTIQTTVPLTCENTGKSVIVPINGIPPYLYSWNNSTFSSDPVFSFTTSGLYSVTVKDALLHTKSLNVYLEGQVDTTTYDLTANLITGSFRTGFNSIIFVDAFNKTCAPVDGHLKVVLSPHLNFINSVPPANSIIGDTLIWNLVNFVYDDIHFKPIISVETKTSTLLTDSIKIVTEISPLLNDVDSIDNVRFYSFPVQNGYDPNDKKVYPVGECVPHFIKPKEKLTYTVRFQNTGNADAINIEVHDLIDENLDISTLRVIGKSHEVYTEIDASKKVKFVFKGIHLPDSATNPIGSQGYVIFEIKPNSTVPEGAEIRNKVAIYFDFNPPIITNSVFNTVSLIDHTISNQYLDIKSCESIILNGHAYDSTGVYKIKYQNVYGCDSIVYLNLTVLNHSDSVLYLTADDSIQINGVKYIESGIFYQHIINSLGCEISLEIHLVVNHTANFLSQNMTHLLHVYPNPFTNTFTLKMDSNISEFSYQIINSVGKIICPPTEHFGSENTIVNLDELSDGMYFLNVITKDFNQMVRLVKEDSKK